MQSRFLFRFIANKRSSRVTALVPHNVLRVFLIGAVCLYSALQWTAGNTIGNSKIFDPKHAEYLENFALFKAALRNELFRECSAEGIHRINFDHLDMGLPFIVNDVTQNPTCLPMRETPVTPFNTLEMTQCSATIVKEAHVSWWIPGIVKAALGPIENSVSKEKSWSSPDGAFGFTVYRKTGCRGAGGDGL
jgi:hypothetical protein